MNRKRKVIACEIKEIDEESRSFLAVASTEDLDRDNDRIMADGWDLENFLKNPVVPWSHKYSDPPVAQATEVYVADGKLMFRPKFATKDTYDFADTIFRLYKGGFLRSFSVGFMPKRYEIVERSKGVRGFDFMEQELWEISAVTVPGNPNALVAAAKKGVISEEEAKALSSGVPKHVKDALDEYVAENRDHLQELADAGNIMAQVFLDLETLEPDGETIARIMEEIDNLGSLFEAPDTLGGVKGLAPQTLIDQQVKYMGRVLERIAGLTDSVNALMERLDKSPETVNPNTTETPKPETPTLDKDQAEELTKALTDGLERRIGGIVSDRLKFYLGKVD